MKLLIIFILITQKILADGFYVGIGAGFTSFATTPQNNVNFSTGRSGTQITNAFTNTVFLGYQYNQYLALQMEYDTMFNTRIANTYDTNQRLLGISLIASLPLYPITSNLVPFVKFGADYSVINYFNVNSSCTQCGTLPNSSFTYLPLYGLGIDYNVNNVVLRSEVDYSPNNTVSQNNTSVFTTNSSLFLLSIYYKF